MIPVVSEKCTPYLYHLFSMDRFTDAGQTGRFDILWRKYCVSTGSVHNRPLPFMGLIFYVLQRNT